MGLIERSVVSTKTHRLIAHLLATGRIAQGGVERAAQAAAESQERFETVLTRLGLMPERELAEVIAKVLDRPMAATADYPQVPVLDSQLNLRFLRETGLIPIAVRDGRLHVAMLYPLDDYPLSALRFACEMPVEVHVAYPAEFEAAFARLYGEAANDDKPR